MDIDIYKHFFEIMEEYEKSAPRPYESHSYISPVTDDGVPIRKLFIGNLAERTTSNDLQRMFSQYGKVDSCYIKRNEGKSNFAFVTFNDVEGGINARRGAERMETQLHCRILRVSAADSWHQPDSIENQKRMSSMKSKHDNTSDISDSMIQVISHEDSTIQVLNDDCLIEIFLYLPIADGIRMERVCKRWQALSRESWRSVKRLDLSKNTWGLSPKTRLQSIDTTTLRKVLIKCGKFLTHLDLSEYPHSLGSSTLTIVGKFCPNLQYINIKSLGLSPSGIHSLMNNCQNISKLIMRSLTGPCEKDLSQLFAINKKLEILEIEDDHIVGRCLNHLPVETIKHLCMISCTSVVSTYLDSALERFTSLKKLMINSCVCLIDNSLKAIGNLTQLTHLELTGNYPSLSANAMTELKNLINLEYLNLDHNISVTDDCLIDIALYCRKLNYLDISGCGAITDRSMVNLSSLPKLETLVMNWVNQVTDESLSNLQYLRVLKCWDCQLIQDQGVINLIKIAPNLELLDFSRCSITNRTLDTAISVTKQRKKNTVLKMIVGNTRVDMTQSTGISPFLQIINIDSAKIFDQLSKSKQQSMPMFRNNFEEEEDELN